MEIMCHLVDGVLWGLLQDEDGEQNGGGGEEEEQLQLEPDGKRPLPTALQKGQPQLVPRSGVSVDFLHRHPAPTLPSHPNRIKIQIVPLLSGTAPR